eukprot:2530431-Rhodomonas_salina.1
MYSGTRSWLGAIAATGELPMSGSSFGQPVGSLAGSSTGTRVLLVLVLLAGIRRLRNAGTGTRGYRRHADPGTRVPGYPD